MVLVVVVVPVLSPAAGGWLVLALVLVNVLLLLPLLLLLLSPRLSLSLMTALSQLILAPFSSTLDLHLPLALDPPPARGGFAFRLGSGGGGINVAGGSDNYDGGGGGGGVAGWVRQTVFVLSVVLGEPQAGVGALVTRFSLWLLGVRTLLSVLAAALVVHDADPPPRPQLSPQQQQQQQQQHQQQQQQRFLAPDRGRISAADDPETLHSLPFYLGQLSVGVAALAHCAQHVPAWDLLGLLVFSVCSDRRVQNSLKLQARKLQVDAVEGFEGELLHGLLILLDLVVCVLFFARAVRREDYPVLVLSYSNGFIALMELRVRVWQEMQAGLRRMSELRRATSVELRAHNDVCAVCLGAMSAARITRCQHLFHGKCLRQALRISPQCPLCKKHVVRHNVYVLDPMAELEG